jgi:hypothetical protein
MSCTAVLAVLAAFFAVLWYGSDILAKLIVGAGLIIYLIIKACYKGIHDLIVQRRR